MTKNERIKWLEDKVLALEARIAMLEAGVGRVPWYVPASNRYPPPGPFTLRDYRCTCGSTAGCPVHGPLTICGTDMVTLVEDAVQWSYTN